MGTATPGPWTVNVWTTGRRTVEASGGLVICEVHDTHVDTERAANAQQIAAAPALLAACKAVLCMYVPSALKACAYQGPPPKKWAREIAPALEAKRELLDRIQAILRPALAAAEGE